MTKDTLKLTTLAGLILAAPAVALAGLSLGDTLGTSEEDIRAKMLAQGYEVIEVEIESDEIEVEYLVDGVEYEAEIDPATGAVIAMEMEDDDGDDEDDDEN